MEPSRRTFMLAVGALVAAGCGGGAGGADPRAAERDVGVVNSLLALENAVVAAYEDGMRLLRGEAEASMRRILAQEREHAAALARTVVELGGVTPAEPKPLAEYRDGFPHMESGRDVLRFAVDLEELSIKRYEDAVARLTRPRLRQLVASAAAAEASHLSVVLGALGRPRVPEAFVTGKS